jgi:hypothetical protein
MRLKSAEIADTVAAEPYRRSWHPFVAAIGVSATGLAAQKWAFPFADGHGWERSGTAWYTLVHCYNSLNSMIVVGVGVLAMRATKLGWQTSGRMASAVGVTAAAFGIGMNVAVETPSIAHSTVLRDVWSCLSAEPATPAIAAHRETSALEELYGDVYSLAVAGLLVGAMWDRDRRRTANRRSAPASAISPAALPLTITDPESVVSITVVSSQPTGAI